MSDNIALRFDHLGVVVSTLEEGRTFFTEAIGIRRWTPVFADHGIGVSVQFGIEDSGPAIELIAPLGEKSPIANALLKGTRILNHVAYLTADIDSSGERLAAQGCVATGPPHPAVAYGGKRVQFWISKLRFMVELIEAPEHEHIYLSPVEGS